MNRVCKKFALCILSYQYKTIFCVRWMFGGKMSSASLTRDHISLMPFAFIQLYILTCRYICVLHDNRILLYTHIPKYIYSYIFTDRFIIHHFLIFKNYYFHFFIQNLLYIYIHRYKTYIRYVHKHMYTYVRILLKRVWRKK